MRIAIGGIGHETNTFSTLTTGLGEFFVRRDAECVREEFWHRFREQGIDLVPTLMASAAPHGPVEYNVYLQLKTELLERLKAALPVDGVYLSLHGAMEVQEIGDGEGDLVSAVRAFVGPDVPIAASLDLHGNTSPSEECRAAAGDRAGNASRSTADATLAVVQVEGVTILLITKRWPFADLSSFKRANIDPLKHKIVVVKWGYLFPELRDNAPRAIMALSPGFTDLRLEQLPYQRIQRPIYPLDPEVEWRAVGG